MKRKIIYSIMLLCTMFSLTGCWDSEELDDRHIVLEMALDKAEDKAEDKENKIGQGDYYEVTYTIPDIKKLSGQESLSDDVKTAMTTVSPTLVKSMDEIEARIQNTITFSHLKAVIFGEELLKDQQLFENAIKSLSRNVEISRGTNILAVQGKASEITKGENYQNPVLGLYIMNYFNNKAKANGNVKQQSIGTILREIQNTGVATMPIITSVDKNTVQIGGAAVIKDYKLIGWLTQDEVRGMNFIRGDVEEVPIVIEYQGQYLTYTISNKKTKIKFKDNDGIEAEIHLLVKGEITEGLSAMNNMIFSPEDIDAIEKILINKVNEKLQIVIEKEKSLGADFLNIELELYRKHPNLWRKYQSGTDEKSIKDIKINLHTDVVIENTGIIE